MSEGQPKPSKGSFRSTLLKPLDMLRNRGNHSRNEATRILSGNITPEDRERHKERKKDEVIKGDPATVIIGPDGFPRFVGNIYKIEERMKEVDQDPPVVTEAELVAQAAGELQRKK